MFDAIVVGAGAAGLMAARELKRAGKHVCVLETSSRVGGRIITLYGTNAGVPIELGAEFIHGDAPETTRLVDEARLVTVPVIGEHYRSDHGELAPQGPIWKRMAELFRHLNPERKKDRSFQDFLDEKPGGSRLREERELARGFVQGFFARGDVEDSAISELARVFGMRRTRLESLVDSIHTYDWTRDSNIRGAYSYAGVGGSHAPRVLARAFYDRVVLAGEATDSGSSGTVEAALATGKRAAHKVLRSLSS